ncbi:MAG: D-glycero-beta-D-manno-heptose 1-phosphate adenylyltransferase [Planctomycetota bacterium]|nr:MAG: D-glycero-beta-D-manno-heptose 1-phosphate adenylyltransferase [Planctomycetota bacterium]
MPEAEKILERKLLADRLAQARREGRKVVLCNGVFDLLHVGHLRALEEARQAGDLLVVAINEDATAKALKGPGRPFTPAAERAELLAGFACVDFVTTFAEPTATTTLEVLRPDFHAKGRDYQDKTIPEEERELCRRLGIQLLLVGDRKTHSSSELLQRLQQSGAAPEAEA